MKKILFILLCLAAVTGCGREAGSNNHGYGYHFDEQGTSGLRVRFDGNTKPTLAEIESLYRQVEACTGIDTTGPLVIFSAVDMTGAQGEPIWGKTYLDTGTVIGALRSNSTATSTTWALKHEFVHYLLHQSGFDYTANLNHQSDFFLDCTVLT